MEMGMLGNPSSSDPFRRHSEEEDETIWNGPLHSAHHRQDHHHVETSSSIQSIKYCKQNKSRPRTTPPIDSPAVHRNTIPHPQPKPCPVMPYSRFPMLQIPHAPDLKKETRNEISSLLPSCQSPRRTVNHHPPFSSSLLLPILQTRVCARNIKPPDQLNLVPKSACPVVKPSYPSTRQCLNLVIKDRQKNIPQHLCPPSAVPCPPSTDVLTPLVLVLTPLVLVLQNRCAPSAASHFGTGSQISSSVRQKTIC